MSGLSENEGQGVGGGDGIGNVIPIEDGGDGGGVRTDDGSNSSLDLELDFHSTDEQMTISELANPENLENTLERATPSQWKTPDVQIVVDAQTQILEKCTNLINLLEAYQDDDDLSFLKGKLKGGVERCKVIRQQLLDSNTRIVRIMECEEHVKALVGSYSVKKPGDL